MAQAQPLPRLITPIPPGTRQNKRTLLIAGSLVVLAGAGLIVIKFGGERPMLSREPRDRPVSEQVITESRGTVPEDLRLPSSYARQVIPRPAEPAVPVVERFTAPIPGVQPASFQGAGSNGDMDHLPPVTQPTMATPPAPIPVQPAAAPPAPTAAKEAPKRWFSKDSPQHGDVLMPPFPEEKDEDGHGHKHSTLFPQAIWETPADPTRVLYADQVVQGLLMQSLNSDIPGTVRIKVTEAVQDRFGQGRMLLPVDTTFLGRQEGQAQYGQSRLPVTITMAILPDGTAIQWKDAKAGDATGATGIPAQVNNHYGKVILGAGLSALLNIGTRAPFGSTANFQQSLPQEFAQDVAQSTGQSAQEIVRRELMVNPTLTVKYATPVTMQFGENVSFQTKPTLVNR